MGKKVSVCENYKGTDIELWHIPGTGYLYYAFIGGRHEFFDAYGGAKIGITISVRSKE